MFNAAHSIRRAFSTQNTDGSCAMLNNARYGRVYSNACIYTPLSLSLALCYQRITKSSCKGISLHMLQPLKGENDTDHTHYD